MCVNLTTCRLCRQMSNASNTMCVCMCVHVCYEARWTVLWLHTGVYSGNVMLFATARSVSVQKHGSSLSDHETNRSWRFSWVDLSTSRSFRRVCLKPLNNVLEANVYIHFIPPFIDWRLSLVTVNAYEAFTPYDPLFFLSFFAIFRVLQFSSYFSES